MALKFRRGTTAQQSGSLAFGEPFVNTTLGTLIVGGATGDITLAVAGTGSTGTFGAISGSGLDITGNANIAGNLTLGGTITIGDASTDNVVVNADLSSSLIPNNDNAFDLGSASNRYRNLYATSISGAIAATNGVVSGSSQVVGILAPLNSFSSSQETKNTTLASYTGSVDTKNSTLATYTASLETKNSTLATYTASLETKNSSLATLTGSLINSQSIDQTKFTTLATYTASLETKNSSLATYTASLETKNSTLATYTASLETKNATLAIYTSSNDSKWSTLGSLSGSFARTNSTNTFNATQTISGSLYVTQDLVVGGSSSIQNISSSNIAIGAAYVTLNTFSPASRYAGFNFIDSGSVGLSGSLYYDSIDDEIVFIHKGNGTNVTSSHVVMGPETYDNLGNETYMTVNRIPKVTNFEHIGNSNISDTGTEISLNSLSSVTGSLRITNDITASAGIINGTLKLSGDLPRLYLTDTIHNDDWSIINTDGTFTIYDDTTSTGKFKIYTSGLTEVTGPLSVTGGISGSIASTNGVVSGSSQIDHNATTNYVANRHIDHTAVSISAGNGLSGGGDISATRTLSLDTASSTFTSGVTTQNNVLGVVSGSRTISGITLGSNLGTLTISTGLSGTSYNGSAGVTIANTGVLSITSNTGLSSNVSATGNVTITNTGVTSNVAGTGISVSGATGAVTITNSGVTSAVAGTGVSVSGATGAVTISIGQSVATNATPTFGNLTINGTITATGDITAYYTSDIRHKNNIQTIANAVLKVKQLNGVTWEWNNDVNEVTKSTPKTGLIAQEVQKVLPQVVTERNDGFLALDYSKMVGLLVEAIKEQQTQIDQLKAQIGSK